MYTRSYIAGDNLANLNDEQDLGLQIDCVRPLEVYTLADFFMISKLKTQALSCIPELLNRIGLAKFEDHE